MPASQSFVSKVNPLKHDCHWVFDEMDAHEAEQFALCLPDVVDIVSRSKDYESRMHEAYSLLVRNLLVP